MEKVGEGEGLQSCWNGWNNGKPGDLENRMSSTLRAKRARKNYNMVVQSWWSWWKVGEIGEEFGEVGDKLVKLVKSWWSWWNWRKVGEVGDKLVNLAKLVKSWWSWWKVGEVGKKWVVFVKHWGSLRINDKNLLNLVCEEQAERRLQTWGGVLAGSLIIDVHKRWCTCRIIDYRFPQAFAILVFRLLARKEPSESFIHEFE